MHRPFQARTPAALPAGLGGILARIGSIEHGALEIVVHAGRIQYVEIREKLRPTRERADRLPMPAA